MRNDTFESYKLAINARNFHYDNFNKWMTFYYVATGAVLVAFYTLHSKKEPNMELLLILSVLGVVISVFWHLSCKGYYFWILNWIEILKEFEKRDDMKQYCRVYSSFSRKVNEQNNSLYHPTKAANISTSKITMIFSLVVSIAWMYLFLDTLEYIQCVKKIMTFTHACNILTLAFYVLKIIISTLFTYCFIWVLRLLKVESELKEDEYSFFPKKL